MNEEIRLLMSNVNTSIIQIRAAYAMWAKVHGLNYHEVLIFYAMRDNEECTQKKIADSYRLPKQTVNNIITSLKKDGYLTLIPVRKNAKEKILALTESGEAYYRSIMEPILEFETLASEKMGKEEHPPDDRPCDEIWSDPGRKHLTSDKYRCNKRRKSQ